MERYGTPVTRAMFERNPEGKIVDAQFNADMSALLRPGFEWQPAEAARTVSGRLISLLPGEPWKGGGRGDGGMSVRRAEASGGSRCSAFGAAVTTEGLICNA